MIDNYLITYAKIDEEGRTTLTKNCNSLIYLQKDIIQDDTSLYNIKWSGICLQRKLKTIKVDLAFDLIQNWMFNRATTETGDHIYEILKKLQHIGSVSMFLNKKITGYISIRELLLRYICAYENGELLKQPRFLQIVFSDVQRF